MLWFILRLRQAVLVLACMCALTPVPLFAQSASFRSVDTNSDKLLELDELIAAFGRLRAKRFLARTDLNADGVVDLAELRSVARQRAAEAESDGEIAATPERDSTKADDDRDEQSADDDTGSDAENDAGSDAGSDENDDDNDNDHDSSEEDDD